MTHSGITRTAAMAASILLVVVLLGGQAQGHTLHLGRTCPDVQPIPNLAVDKILGSWFVIHKTDTDNTCLRWNLTKVEGSDQLRLKETRQLSVLDTFGVDHTHAVTANIDMPNLEVPGRLRIRWPTSITGKADFIVFDTDYEKYMAVFECDRAGLLHRQSVAILSRAPVVGEMFVKRVKRLLQAAEASHRSIDKIDHNNCKALGKHNWHVDGELFDILPGRDESEVRTHVSEGVQDYDLSQIEIVGDGVQAATHRGSIRARPHI